MKDYFNGFQSIDRENETRIQLDTMYHDIHGKFVFQSTRKPDSNKPWCNHVVYANTYADTRYENLCDTDVYASLASFCSAKKTSANVYDRSNLYIDIDCHDEKDNNATLSLLSDTLNLLYETGALPVPTLITFSGRGLGIVYTLDRAVAWKCKNKRAQKKFNCLYSAMIKLYERALKDCPCKVDAQVTDGSRVIRVAGTYNTSAKKTCHLLHQGEYYSMRVLTEYAKEYMYEKTEKKGHTVYNNLTTSYMLKHRIECLFKLAEIGTSYREVTCFLAYNFMMQIMDEREAKGYLYRLNNKFSSPLPEREVMAIIRNLNGREPYHYTTAKIIHVLGLDSSEQKAIGLFQGTKQKMERAEKKKAHVLAKLKRNYEVASYIVEHKDTYEEIAKMFSLSSRTVKSIAKEYGITRYGDRTVSKEEVRAQYEEKVQKNVNSIICFNINTNFDSKSYGKDAETKEESKREEEKKPLSMIDRMKKRQEERRLTASEYSYLQLENFAENVYLATRKGIKDVFAYWIENIHAFGKEEFKHLIDELKKYGQRRIETFMRYAQKHCITEDMKQNKEALCAYFKTDDVSHIQVKKRTLSPKQKENIAKYAYKWSEGCTINPMEVDSTRFLFL